MASSQTKFTLLEFKHQVFKVAKVRPKVQRKQSANENNDGFSRLLLAWQMPQGKSQDVLGDFQMKTDHREYEPKRSILECDTPVSPVLMNTCDT